MTSTDGGRRATNDFGFIRSALRDRGLSHIPIISLRVQLSHDNWKSFTSAETEADEWNMREKISCDRSLSGASRC
jgi:predicted nucleotide-binding protein (sugar kinase/HSP70/actin superfamily)